jgi:hypothetical protein
MDLKTGMAWQHWWLYFIDWICFRSLWIQLRFSTGLAEAMASVFGRVLSSSR